MTDSNKWMFILATIIGCVLLYLLSPILTPFLIAAVLSYIGDPFVDKLEKRMPRTLAVTLVFTGLSLLLFIALIILVPLLERQIGIFVQKLPHYLGQVQNHFLPWITSKLGLPEQTISFDVLETSIREYWSSAGGLAKNMMASVSRSGLILLEVTANLLLIPVVTFYLLRDWDNLVARINELIPRRSQPIVARLATESDMVLGAFLRGQLSVMACLAMIYAVGLSIVGLDLGILIGMLAGLISFVPYLGFIVGIVLAGLAAIMQYQEFIYVFYIAIVFGVGQAFEGMVLTPLLVGDRIGLHPVAVIFAVLAGGQLFGFVGVLLALPVAAVIAVLLRYLHERYMNSTLYSNS